jgi:hypothetical protein
MPAATANAEANVPRAPTITPDKAKAVSATVPALAPATAPAPEESKPVAVPAATPDRALTSPKRVARRRATPAHRTPSVTEQAPAADPGERASGPKNLLDLADDRK